MSTSIELSPHNPWRPADWRWQRAMRIANGELRVNRRIDDATVTRGLRLARALADESDTTGAAQNIFANSDPPLFWAFNLRQRTAPALRAEVEARILASDSDEEILQRTGITPATLRIFEPLFFDVRNRLRTPAYVLHVVMGEEMHKGLSERNYSLLWKYYGYTYGPRMLDAIVGQSVDPYRPRTAGEVKDGLQDHGISSMLINQSLAALTVPINTFTQLDILQVYAKFVEIDRASGKERASQQPHSILSNVEAMLKVLPLDVGPFAQLRVDSLTLSKYDGAAGELNCKQLLLAAQNLLPETETDFEDLAYPEITNHVSAQQGSGAADLQGVG